MELIFTTLAHDELVEAKRFYNRQQQGLGDQFKHEAEIASHRILEHPLAWQFEYDPVRRFIFNRFPYKMLYVIREQKIVVVAVAHQHRAPDYWLDRI
jgi:plasmid stabilization system protein ParE